MVINKSSPPSVHALKEGIGLKRPTPNEESAVMNQLDPIEELYNMYSEEEDTPRIVEVVDDRLDFDSDVEGPANPYMDL